MQQIRISHEVLSGGKQYKRAELAALWGLRGIQGIARGVVTPASTPLIIFFVTKEKQKSFTQYDDDLCGGELHMDGEEQGAADKRIVKAQITGDTVILFYRHKHHNPFVYKGRVLLLNHEFRAGKPTRFSFTLLDC